MKHPNCLVVFHMFTKLSRLSNTVVHEICTNQVVVTLQAVYIGPEWPDPSIGLGTQPFHACDTDRNIVSHCALTGSERFVLSLNQIMFFCLENRVSCGNLRLSFPAYELR